jgi:hypothetical protein
MPGCRVERVTRDGPASLHVAARSLGGVGRCPGCGRVSRAVHSRYRRCPTDPPSLGRTVRVGLHVRRFYCRNTACPRRTFAERLPELVAPHARRTRRLAEAQAGVGAALGGEASARLLPRLAMPASADTVLRLVRRMPLPEQRDPPRVVGVDDWAGARGARTAPSWWTWSDAACWTCSPTGPRRCWPTGCGAGRGSRWSPATARPSTPAASSWARRRRPRSPTAGTC